MRISFFGFFTAGCLVFLSNPVISQQDTGLLKNQTDIEHYLVSFDGMHIYYEVKGEGDPVVLIHGFIANGESWKKTVLYTDLLNAGFKVITPDLRGNGKSDKPHLLKAYEDDAEAKDIRKLVTKLGLKKYSIVGYSRGSIIASRLLVLDKRVSRAVLGGMGSDFTDPKWPRREMFYQALMGRDVKELEGMVKHVKESGLDQRALAYLQKAQPSTSKTELSKVKQPVIVVCGDNDKDNGSAPDLANMMPHATYKEVPGDHNSALRSGEFSKEVIMFFKKINDQ